MTVSPHASVAASWQVLDDVAERAQRYLASLADRRVSPGADAITALGSLDVPLPEHPQSPDALIEELDRVVSPATVASAGPRYFGFVNGATLPGVLAASWLATAWDQNGAFEVMSPGSTRVERVALRWLTTLLGLPDECTGAFVTGTTVAHTTALVAARDSLLEQVGWNARADGLIGAPPLTVIVGEEVHATVFKALGLVGLGRRRVVTVPADGQGRMRADAVPRLAGPTIVCLQAGNVNTGSFDPFAEIIERVRASGVPSWVHVDGAFGLWARVAPARAHLTVGMELADSWAADGHKWLNCPYDSGILLVRHGEALKRSMSVSAEYLPADRDNMSEYTPEMSRRPRGVEVWAALRTLGRSGLAELVERNCRQARRLAEALTAAGVAVLNDVVLNQVLVSFGEPERTRQAITALQEDGTCWCGGTVWQGKTAMRVSIVSWATTDDDIDRSVEAMVRVARD